MNRLLLLIPLLLVLTGCQSISNLWSSTFSRSAPADTAIDVSMLADYNLPNQPFANEAHDYGTPPVSSLVPPNYRAPTPVTLAGGVLIDTPALHLRLTATDRPVVINTLPDANPPMIPGSTWLSGAGQNGNFNDAVQARLQNHLETLTQGDRNRMLVFYANDPEDWSAYNAALRAVNMRYPNVRWYRGGLSAWHTAGLPSSNSPTDLW